MAITSYFLKSDLPALRPVFHYHIAVLSGQASAGTFICFTDYHRVPGSVPIGQLWL